MCINSGTHKTSLLFNFHWSIKMARSFIQSLAFIRSTDTELPAVIAEVAENVLFNWHNHGNKTPYESMLLAINGGVDSKGLFGEKGETIKGVSKGLCLAFSGVKLGKRDPSADIDALVKTATGKGMQTKAEAAAAAKAKRDAKAAAAPTAESEMAAIVGALVMPSGAAIKLTPEECNQLVKTLEQLRAMNTVDAHFTEVEDVVLIEA